QGMALVLQRLLDVMKSLAELVVGAAKRRFRIKLQMTAKVDERKQGVAELILDRSGVTTGQRFAQLCDLFFDLVEDRRCFAPIEADARGLFLKLQRPGERGQVDRHAVQVAFAVVF